MPELEPARSEDRYCLLVDQGNSRIKWISGVWNSISGAWSTDLTTFGEGDISDFEAAFNQGELMLPEEVLLCSVASDSRITEIHDLITRNISAPIVQLTSEKRTASIQNGYHEYDKLGADRWMAVVGAAMHYWFPLVVMDLGTATTLDAIDHEGYHLGGLILPGPGTMMMSLGAGTAMDVDEPATSTQKTLRSGEAQVTTQAAIAGGAISAQLGALDQFLAALQLRLGPLLAHEPEIIVTGGGAGAILGKSDHALIHDPLLVFKGMLICRYGANKETREENA